MPWFACAQVIMDTTEKMETTRKILSVLWDWESDYGERKIVQDLFRVVFDRSAALVAVAIMALSSKTERLQPAMGGLTCTFGGSLYSKCSFYSKAVRSYLPKVLNNNTSDLIHIESVENGASKGAGALCYRLMRCRNIESHH
jgi:hexokinase